MKCIQSSNICFQNDTIMAVQNEMIPGGWTNWTLIKEGHGDVYGLAMRLKHTVELNIGEKLTIYHPRAYKSQVVAGMNYHILIQTSNTKGLKISVYEVPWKDFIQVTSVTKGNMVDLLH